MRQTAPGFGIPPPVPARMDARSVNCGAFLTTSKTVVALTWENKHKRV
jgi:hypothetical protein